MRKITGILGLCLVLLVLASGCRDKEISPKTNLEMGVAGAALIGVFALMGLMSAFLIQLLWLKGKPMPALPPITFLSLIGFLIVSILSG